MSGFPTSSALARPAFPFIPWLFNQASSNAALPAANGAEYALFMVQGFPMAINRVAITPSGGAGNCDVGIYDSSGGSGLPGKLLASNGGTPTPGPGPAASGCIALSKTIVLPVGLYWAALSCTDIATSIFNTTSITNAIDVLFLGSSMPNARANSTAANYPLPATANTPVAVPGTTVFCIVPGLV